MDPTKSPGAVGMWAAVMWRFQVRRDAQPRGAAGVEGAAGALRAAQGAPAVEGLAAYGTGAGAGKASLCIERTEL